MIRLKITGMTCEHCAQTVKKALESVEGVREAKVYFPQGYAEVEIEKEVPVNDLTEAVRRSGYGAEEIKESPEVYIPKEGVYDLFILGGGSAGFAAAIKASDLGAKVLIAEDNIIGGTCLNRGCVPSKYLIEGANTFYTPLRNPFPGIELEEGSIDIKEVIEAKEGLLEGLRKEKYWNVLEAYPQIDYRDCRGKFLGEGKALVGKEEISFGKAVITTGSRPGIPPIKNLHRVRYYTSDDIFNIDHLPEHLIVIGGGAIGLELGQAFLRMGSDVTIVEALPDIAMGEEPELRAKLRELLKREGMNILIGATVSEVREEGEEIVLEVEHRGERRIIRGTDLLVATGRAPNTRDIGLEVVSVKTNSRGFIETNEFMQTSNPNIYAAGDCVGKVMLVTVAAMEGGIAAENALLGNRRSMDYLSVPHAIFTDPELAGVGLKEKEAEEKGIKVDVRVLEFSKVPRAALSFRTDGLIKMIVEKDSEKILGVHILAPHGAELIHKAVLLVRYGLTVDEVIQTVDVYPTLSESIKLCAQTFKKDVSKLSCCAQ
ncbi:mercuric reductase [Hydrogenivirga caldilitoris]|uniref:Mercuric reductase n=1 Tax=Hydrogenivirga caldilitoris TaxID=246264 RepID=A0A497XRM2_9AQUI|nr:mercury(II) reductase [Hydrogenivirga caldilitoris]RLJ70739.1 mercuric reductase [Hydrogenivirga caldilitoris]